MRTGVIQLLGLSIFTANSDMLHLGSRNQARIHTLLENFQSLIRRSSSLKAGLRNSRHSETLATSTFLTHARKSNAMYTSCSMDAMDLLRILHSIMDTMSSQQPTISSWCILTVYAGTRWRVEKTIPRQASSRWQSWIWSNASQLMIMTMKLQSLLISSSKPLQTSSSDSIS